MQNETIHLLVDAAGWAGVAVTVILYIRANKQKAREDAELRQEQLRKDSERRHKQNQQLLAELVLTNNYAPPHSHQEETGPLQAEGIHFAPKEEIQKSIKEVLGEWLDVRLNGK